MLHSTIARNSLIVPKRVSLVKASTSIGSLLREPVVRFFSSHATSHLLKPAKARHLMIVEIRHVRLDVEERRAIEDVDVTHVQDSSLNLD